MYVCVCTSSVAASCMCVLCLCIYDPQCAHVSHACVCGNGCACVCFMRGAVLGGAVVLRVMGVQLWCTDLQMYGPWVCAGGCVQAVLCARMLAVYGVGCVCVTVSVYVHPVQCVLVCAHGCAYACGTV